MKVRESEVSKREEDDGKMGPQHRTNTAFLLGAMANGGFLG